jgi:hypothetical protein
MDRINNESGFRKLSGTCGGARLCRRSHGSRRSNLKTRIFAFVMLTALLLAAAPLNGAYLVYTSKSSWISNVGGVYETEDFNDMTLNPGISFVASGGAITPPVFSDWVSRGEGFTFFHFHTPVKGVGANWDLTPFNSGQGVQIRLEYTTEDFEDLRFEVPNDADGDFFGVVSDIPIGAIRITGGTQQYVGGENSDYAEERYTIDDLVYSPWGSGGGDPPPVGEIPEPATLLLTGLGLTAAAWKRSRRT